MVDEVPTNVERQLAIAQQITHIGSWEWDIAANVVTWSDELYRIYGFEPQSRPITFEFFVSRLHPDDQARVQRAVGQALEKGARFAYPERIVRPDGTIRELDTIGEVARDDKGRPTALIGTCRDVTDERARDETIRLYADIVRNVQIGLSVWEVGDPEDGGSLRLVAFNPAAEKLARRSLDGDLGRSLRDIAPYTGGGKMEHLILKVAREGGVHQASVDRSRDPTNPTRAVAMKAFPLPGGRVGVALEDITAVTVAQRLQDAEHRVLEQIATGADLPGILEAIVLSIEEHSPPTLGSILLLDADGVHVRHGAAPHLPADYTRAIDGAPIGPTEGSCGTAAFLKRPVFVVDIETDPLWVNYRSLAREHGLRACWSTPILAGDGQVLGTFALYYREPRAPTDEDRALIARATHMAGIAIERRQLEDQLRALTARAESVREDERTGIAREIHDELGQALTALKMDLAWLARRLSAAAATSTTGEPASGRSLLEKIQSMSEMTDEVIRQVRRISAQLRPGVLDDLGLLAGIEWQAQEFEKRSRTRVVVESNLDQAQVDRELSTAVFRIFQEALTNVARHADASRVRVRLELTNATLCLEVDDDGKGISEEAARNPRSLGLLGIRERARRLGGAAVVQRLEPKGTRVRLDVPMQGRSAP
jgi:PAS domain S-box-containing protein